MFIKYEYDIPASVYNDLILKLVNLVAIILLIEIGFDADIKKFEIYRYVHNYIYPYMPEHSTTFYFFWGVFAKLAFIKK